MRMTMRVTSIVDLNLIDAAFTPEFIEEFRSTMVPLDTIEDHGEYISGLVVSGVIEEISDHCGLEQVIEGYGRIGDFVSLAKVTSSEAEID